MNYKLFAILLSTLLLLAACSQAPAGSDTSPAKQTPPTPAPAKPVEIIDGPTPSETVVDHSAKPTAPTDGADGEGTGGETGLAGNCYVTAQAIQTACKTTTVPVLKEDGAAGCVFEVPSNSDGAIQASGEVTISVKKNAKLSDYETEISQYKFEEETYELKPRATRIEQHPFTYFFWFTGSELVSLQAHKAVCTSDGLKKIAVEIGTVLDE